MELDTKARWVRKTVLDMVYTAKKGHIGGSLSCVDILVALYYGGILRYDKDSPQWEGRDRFILSKGHAAASLYAILADIGYFPKKWLKGFAKEGDILEGHPHRGIPGVEVNTGSLGHGLGIGAGMALGAKMDGKDWRTFVLMGDGECHEGSVWEAAMFASHHKLNNLVAIIDYNGLCSEDRLRECVDLSALADKWGSFGWSAYEIGGHDIHGVISDLNRWEHLAASLRPKVFIAYTTKGKGVSFMEGKVEWHHRVPTATEYKLAKKELSDE